eukprot:scaffold34200_cov24-Cyclotella_meneghiniana.AAC.6
MFTLKEGIRLQQDYMCQQETISVTGLASYDLISHIPEMDSVRKKNSREESIMKMILSITTYMIDGKAGSSPF